LAAHYIFNMDYHNKVKDLMTFLGVKVAGIDVPEGFKWNALVGSHVNGISRTFETREHDDELAY